MPNPSATPTSIHRSEARDLLPVQSYKNDGQSLVFDLPKTTAIKRLAIRTYGSFEVTYASGSPVADSAGFTGRLLSRVDVVSQGDTVKTVNPYVMQKQQQLLVGLMPRRAYGTSASAPTSTIASTDASSGAPFSYPATTNYVTINEQFVIFFEHPWLYAAESESRKTLLYTRGLSSCQLILQVGAIANVQKYAGGSPVTVTYSNINLSFEVSVIHNPWVLEYPKDPFLYFREINKQYFFQGQTTNGIINAKTNGVITGFLMLARNGDTDKSLSDIAITAMRLKVNGSGGVSSFTWRGLQEDNIGRYGVDSKLASSVHSLQGFAFLNLLTNGHLATGLDTSRYSDVSFEVDTGNPSATTDAPSYTNNVELDITTQDVIRPSWK